MKVAFTLGRRPAPPSPLTKAELRLQKDLDDLALTRYHAGNTFVRISFPNGRWGTNKLNFTCVIGVEEGLYRGGRFEFSIQVPTSYPFEPPVVRCLSPIVHPNFNSKTGAVGLDLLHKDWKPVLSINTVIFGLQLLLLEPNLDCAVDLEVANLAARNRAEYERQARECTRTDISFGLDWESCLSSISARHDHVKRQRSTDSPPTEPDISEMGSEREFTPRPRVELRSPKRCRRNSIINMKRQRGLSASTRHTHVDENDWTVKTVSATLPCSSSTKRKLTQCETASCDTQSDPDPPISSAAYASRMDEGEADGVTEINSRPPSMFVKQLLLTAFPRLNRALVSDVHVPPRSQRVGIEAESPYGELACPIPSRDALIYQSSVLAQENMDGSPSPIPLDACESLTEADTEAMVID